MNQLIEQKFLALFEQQWGKKADRTEMLPASGSARKYWRIYWNGESCIAAWNRNVEENRLFIDFSRHFAEKGLHVPQIYAVSEDRKVYLQEDLGTQTLLDVVGQERKGNSLSEHSMQLYRKSLSELLRFQLIGGQGLDYARCVPRPVFDRQCILWDLNYFKYCFLKLAGADFSEQALEDDFVRLTDALVQEPADSFMFRDFQSRNIMVRAGEVWFIDYQGGRQGALPYDVASLLYDAIVAIPDEQREELLDYSVMLFIVLYWYGCCRRWGLSGFGDFTKENRILSIRYNPVCIALTGFSSPVGWVPIMPKSGGFAGNCSNNS